MKKQYQKLFDSGNWMIRTSDNGKSYQGFQWQPVGKWTEAPDWNPEPECGHGLHGQTRQFHGYFQISGERLELCPTSELIGIGDDKAKSQRAKIIAVNNDIPIEFLEAVGLKFNGKPSLKTLTSVGGDLYINSNVNLPALTSVGGYLSINSNTKVELPALTSVGGDKGKYINSKFIRD